MATLVEIKEKLGISQFELVTALDKEGKKTEWFRHWDNDRRIAVSIHKELATELSKDKFMKIDSLSLQFEQRTGELGPYDAYRIIKYNAATEMTL